MGLDMYLTKRYYIGAYYESNNVKATIDVEVRGKKIPINVNKLSSIEERLFYWRKANHIHNWFVNNVQNGEDNCSSYYVEKEKLEELRNLCKQVLENHQQAENLLPTQKGFFFGNIEYDERYFEQTQETLDMLNEVLKEDDSIFDIYYSSSW